MSKLYPRLEDCRTGVLKGVVDYLLEEARMCDEGISPAEKPVFIALALMLDDELRFRDRRRKPLVPRPPQATPEKKP